MLLKIVYVLTWRTLGLVVVLFRGNRAIAAEVLVLRHENAVLRRQAGLWVLRTSSTSCDQAVFVDHAADARVSSDTVLLKIDRFG